MSANTNVPRPTPNSRSVLPRSGVTVSMDDSPAKRPSDIRNAIAQKRAQVKKSQSMASLAPANEEDSNILRSVDEIVLRGRGTGNINLSSRGLQCLPISLFEAHLGITPEPLSLVSSDHEQTSTGQTSSYDIVDLATLKARNNEIVEIHPELSLFGSMKFLDLHHNKLTFLPDSIGELTNLTHLDLSSNALTSLPRSISTLPCLLTLAIDNNNLTALDLSVDVCASAPPAPSSFFSMKTEKASSSLPSLTTLLAGHNKLVGTAVRLPMGRLVKLDLSMNLLGACGDLLGAVANMQHLKELGLKQCGLDDSFLVGHNGLGSLELLDLEENAAVSRDGALRFLGGRPGTFDDDGRGVRILIGKPVIKEKWELEAERRVRPRRSFQTVPASPPPLNATPPRVPVPPPMDNPPDSPQAGTASLAAWYEPAHGTLRLPPIPLRRARGVAVVDAPAGPTQALPFAAIATQPFVGALRVIVLSNRVAAQVTLTLPADADGSAFPRVEELYLDGCALRDAVCSAGTECGLLATLGALFPGLVLLDLSHNQLTSLAGLDALLGRAGPARARALRTLRLRGNKLTDLDYFVALAEEVRLGAADAPATWSLTELDVRENEITRMPSELGFLPLDTLLVERNLFRVPGSRVWEKEGTQGLLKWLRARAEA